MKRNIKFKILRISVLICVLLIMNLYVYAEPLDSIQILKISPQDERAVVKTPDGKVQIVRTGDLLRVASSPVKKYRAGELKVVEITKGRVVFEEKTDKGIETVIIRVEDGKQRVERIKKTVDKQQQLYAPIH
ncbi:MAG: hypothetical protein HZC12_09450 [Nitrospirae bacterium]|nr:hypothetical protein [Nitrospirota bacterium]